MCLFECCLIGYTRINTAVSTNTNGYRKYDRLIVTYKAK